MTRDNIKFVYDGTTIYVGTTRVKENVTNALTVLTQPTTEETANTSKLLNLNKVEDRFTINFNLCEGKLNAGETYSVAKDKKDGLKTIFSKGNVVTMTWEGDDYSVASDKIEIDYVPRDDNDSTQDGEITYTGIITLVAGDDLI